MPRMGAKKYVRFLFAYLARYRLDAWIVTVVLE